MALRVVSVPGAAAQAADAQAKRTVIVITSLFIGKNRAGIVVVLPDTLSFLSATFAEQSYTLELAKSQNASRMPGELKRPHSTPTELYLMTLLAQGALLGKKIPQGVLH